MKELHRPSMAVVDNLISLNNDETVEGDILQDISFNDAQLLHWMEINGFLLLIISMLRRRYRHATWIIVAYG